MKNKRIPYAEKSRRIKLAKVNHTYELSMDFVIERVNELFDAYKEKNGIETENVPFYEIIDMYEQQDLIIAIMLGQIEKPKSWELGIDSHFINLEDDEVLTIPFSITLPSMNFNEVMHENELLVNRENGAQTNWKGLQAEMIDNWNSVGIPSGYQLVQSQVRTTVNAKFINYNMLKEFENLIKARDQGKLIQLIKKAAGVI